MSELTITLPPYREPHIEVSRTPSPVREGSYPPDAQISGVELIVSKLPRNSITSAAHHLRSILAEQSLQHPSDPLVPVRVVPGDEHTPVDYVFVSVDPAVTQEPRPDLLEEVRIFLTSLHSLQADWRVGEGPDRTRRIHFQVNSFAQAEDLLPKLRTHLNRRGCLFQRSFASKTLDRITFDLLDRASVDNLFETPPVIDDRTFYPSVPRYIQPVYALEVGVFGIQEALQAAPTIDRYIKSNYGDVIASSRLVFNGDAYCVVFKTWAQASRFLSDPFTAFDSGSEISHSVSRAPPAPALLYVLNSNGLPFSARPPEFLNASIRHAEAEFKLLQQKLETQTRVVEAFRIQQEHILQLFEDNGQRNAACISGLSTIMSCSTRLQPAAVRLQTLQSDERTFQAFLDFAPPDCRDAVIQHLQYLTSEIPAQLIAVERAQDSLSAAEQLLASLSVPFPPHPASS